MGDFFLEIKEKDTVILRGIITGEIPEINFLISRYNTNRIQRRMTIREIGTSHPLNDVLNRVAAI